MGALRATVSVRGREIDILFLTLNSVARQIIKADL